MKRRRGFVDQTLRRLRAHHAGLDRWLNDRYAQEPANAPAIHQHIHAAPAQHASVSPVKVVVQNAAWVEGDPFVLTLAARVKDGEQFELHPTGNIDADSAYDPDMAGIGEDARVGHWLGAEKGFGVPASVMDDPSKTLLPFAETRVTIDAAYGVTMRLSVYDPLRDETGGVLEMHQFDLACAGPDVIGARLEAAHTGLLENRDAPEEGKAQEYASQLVAARAAIVEQTRQVQAAIRDDTDENGCLSPVCHDDLRLAPPENDAHDVVRNAISCAQGCALFQIKARWRAGFAQGNRPRPRQRLRPCASLLDVYSWEKRN